MRTFPHTKRNHRSGNWVYFRRFPCAVRNTVGRTFFERSLGTSDRGKLANAWKIAHQEFEDTVRAAAECLAPVVDVDQPPREMGTPTIQAAMAAWDGNVAATQAPLELKIEDVRNLVKFWGENEQYRRADRLLNDPVYSQDNATFEDECELIGACGRRRK